MVFWAFHDPENRRRYRMALDVNKDDKLSREELPERLRDGFARADANNDGSISKQEHIAIVSRGQQQAKKGPQSRPVPPEIEALRDIAYADTENARQKLDLFLPKTRTRSRRGASPISITRPSRFGRCRRCGPSPPQTRNEWLSFSMPHATTRPA